MSRRTADLETERADDLRELARLTKRINRAKGVLERLYEARRAIWRRRLDAGDVKKAELARVSEVTPMTITFGLADDE